MEISLEQHDIQKIAKSVCDQLTPEFKKILGSSGDNLVDKFGAAEILGVAPEWIDNNYKKIPSYKVGGHRRYSPRALREWVKQSGMNNE